MGKIYVLTDGEYSDYQICSATTNKELAEAFAKLHKWDIEEFEDADDNAVIEEAEKMVKVFEIEFNPDGTIYFTDERYERSGFENEYDLCDDIHDIDHGFFSAVVKNDDLNTAIKIARDARAKIIAEKMGL